jgi:hypothetical protein
MNNKKTFNHKEIFDKLMEFPLTVTVANMEREKFLKETFKGCVGQYRYFIGFAAIELEKNTVIGKTNLIGLMSDLAAAAMSIAEDEAFDEIRLCIAGRKNEEYEEAKRMWDEMNKGDVA